jgi:hypothetical protein
MEGGYGRPPWSMTAILTRNITNNLYDSNFMAPSSVTMSVCTPPLLNSILHIPLRFFQGVFDKSVKPRVFALQGSPGPGAAHVYPGLRKLSYFVIDASRDI